MRGASGEKPVSKKNQELGRVGGKGTSGTTSSFRKGSILREDFSPERRGGGSTGQVSSGLPSHLAGKERGENHVVEPDVRGDAESFPWESIWKIGERSGITSPSQQSEKVARGHGSGTG